MHKKMISLPARRQPAARLHAHPPPTPPRGPPPPPPPTPPPPRPPRGAPGGLPPFPPIPPPPPLPPPPPPPPPQLEENDLTGPVPVELCALSQLTKLNLYTNHLTRPIPHRHSDVSRLQTHHVRPRCSPL